MALAEQGTGSGPSKLYWQFEYLVDNRRMDLSQPRRTLEGEKTLTPLMFSCSPNLLLPRQGKRINLIHIFKKSVAQKLVAEKLQPPGSYQNLHRRTRSQGVHDDNVPPRAVSDHIRLGRSEVSATSGSLGQHRRVSSADQHQPSRTSSQYHSGRTSPPT
ncbi:hypothetical protein CPB83DRAFT_842017 [Crepidotus variabilis]|uniref:Uncharacterized protein n=1 Tax=Crepidotus variabilis TaxID=179855 RepID=A0A9P6EU89_9AGAR|nr:hypothetical protein CPB83DRAFT_842017 [Crepidotus variabilis]